jgi:hypothetical protein
MVITAKFTFGHGDPNESSSESSNDEGGSLAGKLSVMVHHLFFPFLVPESVNYPIFWITQISGSPSIDCL